MDFTKWTETERLYQVRRQLQKECEAQGAASLVVTYKAKVKLHGTNAGIRIEAGDTGFQGRKRNVGSLAEGNAEDFYGFQDALSGFDADAVRNSDFAVDSDYGKGPIRDIIAGGGSVTVYGEWAGPGIQRRVACSKVPAKFFAIFAVRVVRNDDAIIETVVEPADISAIIGGNQPEVVHVLPWHNGGATLEVDITNDAKYDAAHAEADRRMLEVEKCDPWIKATFGVDGVGEGLVFYPVATSKMMDDRRKFESSKLDASFVTTNLFKVKGNEHEKGMKQANRAPTERDLAIMKFVKELATPACDALWDAGRYPDPQDIPAWRQAAGPAIKSAILAALEDKAANPEGYGWKDVKGDAGKFAVGYMRDRLGF